MKRTLWLLSLCLVPIFGLVACGGQDRTISDVGLPVTVTQSAGRGEELPTEEAEPSMTPAVTESIISASPTAIMTAKAGIVYAVPFQVRPDGFSFRNYGPGYPEGAFTVEDLRTQFGDGVCSRVEDSGTCVPSAEAQQWIEDRNADMQSGHCIGFTVTSYRFAEGDLDPAAFSDSAAVPFDLVQDTPIMRTIAANGALYWVKSVWSSEVTGTPREIVDALIALGEPVDLSIYLPGLVGGHSLLAYGVRQLGPDAYQILVYDNNFPGEERQVEVDYAANTWRYAQGAVNPNVAAVPYEGDATSNTLSFIPLQSYETATCPFCLSEAPVDRDDEGTTLISVLGQGDVLVKSALGLIGSVAGEIINEIPGARLLFHRGQLAGTDSPDIVLPSGTDYSLEFNALQRVSGLGTNLSFVVDDMVSGTENNVLEVAQEDGRLGFKSGGEQAPLLNVTVRDDESTYTVSLLGIEFGEGEGLVLAPAVNGEGLEIQPQSLDITDATLLITRQTAEDESIFATSALSVPEGERIALDLTGWAGSGSLDVYTDTNGDGTYNEIPKRLPSQSLGTILLASDADEAARIVGRLSPYLDDVAVASVLTGLSQRGLSGREIGGLLRPLDLTDAQLLEVISSLELSPAALGDLLFALRLAPERLEALVSGIGLEAEDEALLREHLENLALYQSILIEWRFRRSSDVAELAEFLSSKDLSADHLAQLLPQFGLSDVDLNQLLALMGFSADEIEQLSAEIEQSDQVVFAQIPAPPTVRSRPSAVVTADPLQTTPTATPTTGPTITMTPTVPSPQPPTGTPATDAYPAAPPPPTRTPSAYPYPGPLPSPAPTATPDPYPGARPSPTPDYDSDAFCLDDDLRIVAQEPGWRDVTVEIWLGEERLAIGEIDADGRPFEFTLTGPGTWRDLTIRSLVEPMRVPLEAISCPAP